MPAHAELHQPYLRAWVLEVMQDKAKSWIFEDLVSGMDAPVTTEKSTSLVVKPRSTQPDRL